MAMAPLPGGVDMAHMVEVGGMESSVETKIRYKREETSYKVEVEVKVEEV